MFGTAGTCACAGSNQYYIALTKIDSKVCQLTELAIRVYDNVTSVKFQYIGI